MKEPAPLSNKVVEDLLTAERMAFAKYCKDTSQDPSTAERVLLEAVKEESRRYADWLCGSRPIPSQFQRLLSSIDGAKDLWTAKHTISCISRMRYRERIAKTSSRIPTNAAYLRDLSRSLGLAAQADDNANLVDSIVSAIPWFHRFDLQFNAFVSNRSGIRGVPCLCIYELLKSATDFLADFLVVPLVVTHDTRGLHMSPSADCTTCASDEAFMLSLKSCFDFMFGDTDRVAIRPQVRRAHEIPAGPVARAFVAMGAQDFAAYHEYGHLLQGHLAVGPCRKVEEEADLFALVILANESDLPPDQTFFRILGVIMLFTLLIILEDRYGRPADDVHPPGRARFQGLMRVLDAVVTDQLMRVLRDCTQNLVAALKPTLSKFYGLTLDL